MRLVLKSALWAFVPLLVLYLIAPILIWLFPTFFQHIFFLNFVKIPYTDYHNLTKYNVYGGRNFYINVEDTQADPNTTIGVWHIFPKSLRAQLLDDGYLTEERSKELVQNNPNGILVYLHGNSFDRTSPHRCELYRILSEIDLHILAIDYRGYGDSTGKPTEEGLIKDAKAIYNYAMELDPTKPIFVWGHSMGTGVATRMSAEISIKGHPPAALVLEAPFNNLHDVISHHPFSVPFRFLPWFEATVIEPLIKSGLLMQSDKHIANVDCPILVFHAQDDHIIPVSLARKLVNSARNSNRIIKYIEFDASRKFLHKYMHRAKEMPGIVMDFFFYRAQTRSILINTI